MRRVPVIIVLGLLAASSCTQDPPDAASFAASDDHRHNGVDVVEVAQTSGPIPWESETLPDDVAYDGILDWVSFASIAVDDSRRDDAFCADMMEVFVTDIVGGESESQAGLAQAVIGLSVGLVYGAAAAVEPGTPQHAWLTECAETFHSVLAGTTNSQMRRSRSEEDIATADEEKTYPTHTRRHATKNRGA